MATAELLPIHTKISQTVLRKAVRRREMYGTEIVGGLELFWLALRCPMHAWSWPRTNKEERFDGYDAHQTCHKCTSLRMFDTREWQSGPVYRRHREYANQETSAAREPSASWSAPRHALRLVISRR